MESKPCPTLTQLHAQDIPDISFLLQIPSTTRCPPNGDERYRNSKRYLLSEPDEGSTSDEYDQHHRRVTAYRILPLLEGTVTLCDAPEHYPPPVLVNHWAEKFHDGVPITIRRTGVNDPGPHFVAFPLENVPKEHQAIDPDVLYEIHSKRFIGSIPCPQARIQDTPSYPCVLKLCISTCAKGVWFVKSEEEYQERLSAIQAVTPNADYVITDLVQNIVKNYAVHSYLNKAGDLIWIGAAEQRFNKAGIFAGGIYVHDDQPNVKRLTFSAITSVAQTLHTKGYFGYLSIDVLIDRDEQPYVIDINPRWGGTTVSILGTVNYMLQKGYRCASHLSYAHFQGPLELVLQQLGTIQGGEVVVIVASGVDTLICEVDVYAPSLADIERIEDEIHAMEAPPSEHYNSADSDTLDR